MRALCYTQVLLRLVREEGIAAQAFLEALVAMPLTLHGLEVVNRLTSGMRLPSQHVAAYISGCIASCERTQASFLHPCSTGTQYDKTAEWRATRVCCSF